MSKLENNPMIFPRYKESPEIMKIRVETPALIFGCGAMVHEKLFLDFDDPKNIYLYDPDPIQLLDKTIIVQKVRRKIIKKWQSIPRDIHYKSIICFFSLHFVPNWLDKVWELHDLLEENGKLFFAEDKGFRALLDFNYNLIDKRIDQAIISEVWKKFTKRIEEGFPWYPDISAGNMSQLREILSPFYQYDIHAGKKEFVLEREYIKDEIPCYLPWDETRWKFNKEHYPVLSSLKTAKEIIIIYELKKITEKLPPLWDLYNNEFINNIWSLKMLHCHHALIRNSPIFEDENDSVLSIEQQKESVRKFINSYTMILYQHLLRHLPGGLAEFVSLSPERFYEFTTPQKKYFDNLPVLPWEPEKLSLSAIPPWYKDYLKQLEDTYGGLTWAGEDFLVKNTGALNYLLKIPFDVAQNFDRYYSSHFYSQDYCNSYGFVSKVPENWEKREINPCIYMTVQASKGINEDIKTDNNIAMHAPYIKQRNLKYVGFVLYFPNKEVTVEVNKYILIGGIISHLLAYVQSQVTSFLAVKALEVSLPILVRNIYKSLDIKQLETIYNKIFPASSIDRELKVQHQMEDITSSNTKHNISKLDTSSQKMLNNYFNNLQHFELDSLLKSNYKCKWLKAIIGRNKETCYLLDIYLDIYKTHKSNEFNSKLKEIEKLLKNKEGKTEFKFKPGYAFWYIKEIIDMLLSLKQTDSIGLNKVFLGHNFLLILTTGEKFPEIFYHKEDASSGSFRSYVKTLINYHFKLLECEHTFLNLKFDCSLKDFIDENVSISEYLNQVPPPHKWDFKSSYIQLSHLYLFFNNTGRNALLLRKYSDADASANGD